MSASGRRRRARRGRQHLRSLGCLRRRLPSPCTSCSWDTTTSAKAWKLSQSDEIELAGPIVERPGCSQSCFLRATVLAVPLPASLDLSRLSTPTTLTQRAHSTRARPHCRRACAHPLSLLPIAIALSLVCPRRPPLLASQTKPPGIHRLSHIPAHRTRNLPSFLPTQLGSSRPSPPLSSTLFSNLLVLLCAHHYAH